MLHLHSLGIVHRDMKPENIFMRDKKDPLSCVVADMDMAIIYDETNKRSRRGHVGTPGYMPPEILQNKEYDFQVDVWSLGVTFFMILGAGLPFPPEMSRKAKTLICDGEYAVDGPNWGPRSAEAHQLLKKMLTVNLTHTPTAL